MNWLKQNPVLAAICAAAILLLGTLAFLLQEQNSALAGQRESYESQVTQLHKLQNQSPYPSKENLAKVRESNDAYRRELIAFEQKLQELQPPIPERVSPQQFQDDLRRVVSEVQAKAKETGTRLPDTFYMGFNRFQTGLPTPGAAPLLSRQLEVLRGLVEAMLETKISALNLELSEAEPARPIRSEDEKSPSPDKIITRTPANFTLTGEQGRVRMAINTLLKSPQFLIVRAIRIKNSSEVGPPRLQGAAPNEGPPADASGNLDAFLNNLSQSPADGQRRENLAVLLGRETITATLRIELLDFADLKLQ